MFWRHCALSLLCFFPATFFDLETCYQSDFLGKDAVRAPLASPTPLSAEACPETTQVGYEVDLKQSFPKSCSIPGLAPRISPSANNGSVDLWALQLQEQQQHPLVQEVPCAFPRHSVDHLQIQEQVEVDKECTISNQSRQAAEQLPSFRPDGSGYHGAALEQVDTNEKSGDSRALSSRALWLHPNESNPCNRERSSGSRLFYSYARAIGPAADEIPRPTPSGSLYRAHRSLRYSA